MNVVTANPVMTLMPTTTKTKATGRHRACVHAERGHFEYNHRPLVLWLCKIVSKMTYNVSSGTLNPTIPYHRVQLAILMLILSMSVTFSVTCLTVTSLIMTSCQQHWPIHSCSFYKVVQIWGMVVDFRVHLVTVELIYSVCNNERIIKIKSVSIYQCYAQMKKGTVSWLTVYIHFLILCFNASVLFKMFGIPSI